MLVDIKVEPDGDRFKVVFTPQMHDAPTPEITFHMHDRAGADELAKALDNVAGVTYVPVAP